jgi:tRNA(Ile)-lysidine synthase
MDGGWNSKLKSAINLTVEWALQTLNALTPSKCFCVGLSGGLDSHVLVKLMADVCAINTEYQVRAIHIHHGLSEHANRWAEHCETMCNSLKVPLVVRRVQVEGTLGRSPEEMAREARFKAFSECLADSESLLLAHHSDDQTETILLRLFRGAGPLGLGGMSEQSRLGTNEIVRPFLSVSKEILIDYATTHNLQWIEDDSNENLRFDRNFLRHEILPRLKARWPKMVTATNRSGALCLEAAMVAQTLAASDWIDVQGSSANSLSVSRLLKLEPIRRRGVLRYWLQVQNFTLPSRDHIQRIDREILKAKAGAKPRLKIASYEISRYKDDLIVQ